MNILAHPERPWPIILSLLLLLQHIRLGVLLQVELTALPGHAAEDGFASRFEATLQPS